MQRRTFLGTALAAVNASRLFAAPRGGRWDDAAAVLEQATAAKQVDAAVLHVVQRGESFTCAFGTAASGDAMFLLGSVSGLRALPRAAMNSPRNLAMSGAEACVPPQGAPSFRQ